MSLIAIIISKGIKYKYNQNKHAQKRLTEMVYNVSWKYAYRWLENLDYIMTLRYSAIIIKQNVMSGIVKILY